MSLETVAEDIREQARARADEIVAEAEQEAEQIRDEAREEAEEIRADIEQETDRQIEQEREQKLSSAKLEAKQMRLEARRDVIQSVRDDVEQAVADIEGDQREELTRALLEDALGEFGDDEELAVYGRAGDEDLLESLLAEREHCTYAGEVDCLGGVVVESEQSRVRVKNTFDSVFAEVWEDSLREISDRLFEDE
jgi:V/A-type H+-transporting ATPase subunit E